ncbi:MAG: hypothetical protein WC714_29115 [Candidatus Obscuribacterales bacterium]|jgi:hypothetical protein
MNEIMPYLAAVLGFLAIYVLNSIKTEIKDIKVSLNGLEKDMRVGVGGLERRITVMETRFQSHEEHHEHTRRAGNGYHVEHDEP